MKFSLIKVSKVNSDYYNIEVIDYDDNVVYKATLDKVDTFMLILKYKNVKFV